MTAKHDPELEYGEEMRQAKQRFIDNGEFKVSVIQQNVNRWITAFQWALKNAWSVKEIAELREIGCPCKRYIEKANRKLIYMAKQEKYRLRRDRYRR